MNRRIVAVAGMVVALTAIGANACTADAAGLDSLLSGQFVSIAASMLPPGSVTYNDATCPSESRWPREACEPPFWTTLGLFIAFGIASVLFWAYFKLNEQRRGAVARD